MLGARSIRGFEVRRRPALPSVEKEAARAAVKWRLAERGGGIICESEGQLDLERESRGTHFSAIFQAMKSSLRPPGDSQKSESKIIPPSASSILCAAASSLSTVASSSFPPPVEPFIASSDQPGSSPNAPLASSSSKTR